MVMHGLTTPKTLVYSPIPFSAQSFHLTVIDECQFLSTSPDDHSMLIKLRTDSKTERNVRLRTMEKEYRTIQSTCPPSSNSGTVCEPSRAGPDASATADEGASNIMSPAPPAAASKVPMVCYVPYRIRWTSAQPKVERSLPRRRSHHWRFKLAAEQRLSEGGSRTIGVGLAKSVWLPLSDGADGGDRWHRFRDIPLIIAFFFSFLLFIMARRGSWSLI
jgi:hypothetical protein